MMKNQQSQAHTSKLGFKKVHIVRLDSGAINIPVEFIENMVVPHSDGKALKITIKRGSFWAWR